MVFPKPTPPAQKSNLKKVNVARKVNKPVNHHRREKKVAPKEKMFWWQAELVDVATTNPEPYYLYVEAPTEVSALSKFMNDFHLRDFPTKIKQVKLREYLVEDILQDVYQVKAVTVEHAKDVFMKKFPDLKIYKVTKKPFEQREHLTVRPFANLKSLLKEAGK